MQWDKLLGMQLVIRQKSERRLFHMPIARSPVPVGRQTCQNYAWRNQIVLNEGAIRVARWVPGQV